MDQQYIDSNKNRPASGFGYEENGGVVDGLTKREYAAIHITAALLKEYVDKPLPAVMEAVNAVAIKIADDLFNQLAR